MTAEVHLKPKAESVSTFRFCEWISRNINVAMAVGVAGQSSFLVLTAILYLAGSNVFPADFTDVPLEIQQDESYRRVVAWNHRNDDPLEPMFRPSFIEEKIVRREVADILEIYYEASETDPNILSADNLRLIAEFEDSLKQLPYYQKFCVLDVNDRCIAAQSLVSYLNKPMNASCNDTCPDPFTDKLIEAKLETMARDASLKSVLSDFLDKHTDLDFLPVKARTLRSYFFISWATYPKNENESSNEPGCPNSTKQYASSILGPFFWNVSQKGIQKGNKAINFYYYNQYLYFDRLRVQVIDDQLLAIGSFLFNFLYLWMSTRSLFVTSMALYGIFTNFFAAYLIYRYVFDFAYFGVFNVLAVFINLGIGVDDIFVFLEAWTVTGDKQFPSLAARLSAAFRDSVFTMLVTSFITVVAFIVNAFTPLLAIASFGLFSACLVIVNYISVITYFPCIIAFYHARIENRFCTSCPKFLRGSKQVDVPSAPPTPCSSQSSADNSEIGESPAPRSRVSQKFCNWYNALILQPSVQAAFLACTAGVLGFLIYSATRLTVDTEPVRLYIDSHPMGTALLKRKNDFNIPVHYKGMQNSQIYFIWGIQDLDRSMCQKTDWKNCAGKVVWDNSFDLNPYHAQRDLLWFCQYIRSLHKRAADKLRLKTTDGKPDVLCFVEAMDDFLEKEFKNILYSSRKLTGLPTTDVKIEALMMKYPQFYDISGVTQNPFFSRYFETATLYWLHNGYRFLSHSLVLPTNLDLHLPDKNTQELLKYLTQAQIQQLPQSQREQILKAQAQLQAKDKTPSTSTASLIEAPSNLIKYGALVGHSLNSSDLQETAILGNLSLTYGAKLRYAAIVVNTTIPLEGLSYVDGLHLLEEWEVFFRDAKMKMSSTLQRGYVATPDRNGLTGGLQHWLKVQEMLSVSAWQGVILGLSLAFPILVFSTNDFLVGGLATLMIACTTVAVIGVIPLAGWKLGVLESLNLNLVVGLAIDYIVHVAEGYHLSKKTTRREKVQELMQQIGVSVLSGALTTLGASFFLLFAQIAFFMQFGLFIFCTVGFSLLFSLGMFIILLALFGPESDRFSASRICSAVGRRSMNLLLSKWQFGSRVQSSDSRTDSIHSCTTRDTLFTTDSNTSGPRKVSQRLSSSIDDDNLSSGYDSGSVLILPSLSDKCRNAATHLTMSDVSDIDDILSPHRVQHPNSLRFSKQSSDSFDSSTSDSSVNSNVLPQPVNKLYGPLKIIGPESKRFTSIPEETGSFSSVNRDRSASIKSTNSNHNKKSSPKTTNLTHAVTSRQQPSHDYPEDPKGSAPFSIVTIHGDLTRKSLADDFYPTKFPRQK